MAKHLSECYKFSKDGTVLKLPEEGSTMKFKNFRNKIKRPYIFYADLESSLIKTGDDKKVATHAPNSCCCYFVCSSDEI
jgi:hypothetical protein